MPRSLRIIATLLFAAASGAAAADPEFIGAAACSGCHAEQAKLHNASAHALSLARPLEHRVAKQLAPPQEIVRDGRFQFEIGAEESSLVVRAHDALNASESETMPVDWAFGAGDQAVTLVSRVDEDSYIEHHWSYYSGPGRYAVTPGHQGVDADDLGQALGVRYKTFSPQSEILRCFRCHSTGPLALGEQFEIVPAELGVRCESCHGPGSAHVAAVASGDVEAARPLIENPSRLSPEGLIDRCGSCHRPPAAEPSDVDYRDPWNVRHQPVYLTQSACFVESAKLTCMNCHNPHDRVRRDDAAHYRTQCLSCHSGDNLEPAAACGEPTQADCTSCHMPKARPHEHLTFTNHWIGVYESDDLLVPRR